MKALKLSDPLWVLLPVGILVASSAGALASQGPMLSMILAGTAGLVALGTLGSRIESVFLGSLLFALAGYAMQGKGFAYIGIPPLYVGEIVLGLGVLALVLGHAHARFSVTQVLLATFMIFGAIRTIPFVRQYNLDALRDAALWYYAAFALILSMLLTRERLNTAVRILAGGVPWLTIWIAIMSVLFRFLPGSLPHFPGSPVPLLDNMKAGDKAVILATLAAFVLAGLYYDSSSHRWMPPSVFWPLWMTSAFLVAVQTRGGMLAMAAAFGVVALIQPSRQWFKLAFVGSVILVLLIMVNPSIDTGSGRTISMDQLTLNVKSIFSDETGNQGQVQGNKDWRLQWWGEIWGYTVEGPYFWQGKGFGINLATDDGFQAPDGTLRSPHSSHMTVLARMGVTGAAIWLALQLTFAVGMVLSILRSRARRQSHEARVKTWLLAVWAAALVNASFDVYLEGPQGAIIFWSVFGAGVAAMRLDRTRQPEHDAASTPVHSQGALGAHTASA